MNKELLAKAHKALNGDLSNIEDIHSSDKYLFLNTIENRYTSRIDKDGNPDWCIYICNFKEFNNYKGDNTKTVRDAVIEFKGEIPTKDTDGDEIYFSDVIIYCHTKGEQAIKGEFNFGTGDYKKDVYCYVCSQIEFNTYVDLLESNMGRATQTYKEYKKEFEYMTTPTIDYTSEEFWKDAPEGATHYKLSLYGAATSRWYMANENEFALMFDGCWDDSGWESTDVINNAVGSWKVSFIPRPQPKPVFTQEMSDNGELPQSGVECMILFDGDSEPEWHKITWYGLFNGNPSFLCKGKQCWPERGGEFHIKPLAPPVDLIDGKAYQFDIECTGTTDTVGIYNKSGCKFIMQGRKVHDSYCSNIKPLTVDVSAK